MDRRTDGQTDRQIDRQTDRHTTTAYRPTALVERRAVKIHVIVDDWPKDSFTPARLSWPFCQILSTRRPK